MIVASHERSGTHFTMNTLASCFDFISAPWVNFDHTSFNINYFASHAVADLIRQLAAVRPANIIKTHHAFEFFAEALPRCGDEISVIYVYRHPADVLASYWRFLHSWPWTEGPRCATVLEFATSEPMGRLMRLQYRQAPTMLDRWADHVQRWLDAAARSPSIHLVRYEDLDGDFAATVDQLGEALGLRPSGLTRPSRSENVVGHGRVPFEPVAGADNRWAVAELAMVRHRGLMARLGYGAALPSRAAPNGIEDQASVSAAITKV
ncbi:MAG TPA: sulfotransferase domain-containing protein [Phenylobacterium sp.]|uniref:sulfotransferase domain-containing protein n=1 Tax=Phenylobacterium sp. TaxID=1871053 RepID=UPI002BEF9CC4|nr:sulfotransferase domain-containing protein [Phenylobacterium sp.]HSV03618.1 sulfotransferase domain-containing protein [Phenylobacterium sp.]